MIPVQVVPQTPAVRRLSPAPVNTIRHAHALKLEVFYHQGYGAWSHTACNERGDMYADLTDSPEQPEGFLERAELALARLP